MINEDLVEQQALAWFQETGWAYLPGSALTPETAPEERADGRAVVLAERLAATVGRLNPQLSAEAVQEVVRRAVTRQHPDTARANRLLHRLLIDGVPVEYTADDGTKKADQARLIDFTDPAANDLLVVNQFVEVKLPPPAAFRRLLRRMPASLPGHRRSSRQLLGERPS